MSRLSSLQSLAEWWRKWRFVALLVLVAAVGSIGLTVAWSRHRMPGLVRNPPWLMWGNSQTIELNQTNPNTNPKVSGQLVRIAYARPENWRFLFYAQIIEVRGLGNATLDINFNVQPGLGRSQVTLLGFEHYHFNITGPTNNGLTAYSTSVVGPPRSNVGTPVALENIISQFPGQDIQVNVDITLSALTTQDVVVRVDAYFTPNVHIRPEWYKGKMGQEEDQGR